MNAKSSSRAACLALALVLGCLNGCSVSKGEAALQAIDVQEKAWEAKDPSAADLTSQQLIDMYRSVASDFPDVANTANERIARVANWQSLASR
jgi:hypothetical protein